MTLSNTPNPEASPGGEPGLTGQGAAALVHTLKALFKILSVLIVVAFAYVLFSNCIVLDSNEQAMVFHFGSLAKKTVAAQGGGSEKAEVLQPGEFYFAWPAPVDYVKRIPATNNDFVTTYQFWPTRSNRPLEENGAIIEDYKTIKPGQDGYLLTGDSYIVHMKWTMNYQVKDPKKFYLNFYQDPDPKPGDPPVASNRSIKALLCSLLEEAVLIECASCSIDDLGYGSGEPAKDAKAKDLCNRVAARLEREIQSLDIGIEVLTVANDGKSPPLATLEAFNAVIQARQDFDKQKTEAEQAKLLAINEAKGRSARIQAEASTYKSRVVAQVQAQGSYFQAILDSYEKGGAGATLEARLAVLYADALRSALQASGDKYAVNKAQGADQELRINIYPLKKQNQVQVVSQSNQLGAPQAPAAPAAGAPAAPAPNP